MLGEMRKTKVVVTIGPSVASPEMIEKLIELGVNVFRLNFSHGTHEQHAQSIAWIREISVRRRMPVAILQDIQGPKIRVRDVQGEINLETGGVYRLTSQKVPTTATIASVSYPNLENEIRKGATVLIDDGKIELKVEIVEHDCLVCRVIGGGPVTSNKGVNFPGTALSINSVTEKDKKDIIFGLQQKVDFIAVSFVQKASDILDARKLVEGCGYTPHFIAKIERQPAVNNIESIIDVSDGVMVARGDLGVEIPTEEVPLVQKSVIHLCRSKGKPVITATQMLNSMVYNTRPTRAEATDITNAILDGSDGVMLSDETAVGQHPLKAVETMIRIAEKADVELGSRFHAPTISKGSMSLSESIGVAASEIALNIGARAIVTATYSGYTAKNVSRYRPPMLVIAPTHNAVTFNQLNLVWGVRPLLISNAPNTDDLIAQILEESKTKGILASGDVVVITAGVPLGISGTTNLIKVEVV